MTLPLHRDPETIALSRAALAQMAQQCRSLRFASVLTDDGFEVTNTAHDGAPNNRMAAMVSSMQALGDAIVRDLAMGVSDYAIIAAPGGYVIQMRVEGAAMLLAASFDASETVGKALSVTRIAARRMAAPALREPA